MYVNKTDVREFNAKLLTVEFQPPQTVVNVEMYDSALIPVESNTNTPLSTLKIQMLFRGETRNEIHKYISRFLSNLQKGCDLILDGYEHKFRGYLKSCSDTKTKSKKRYTVDVEFDGYWFGDKKEIEFDGIQKIEFDLIGDRSTPAIIELTAKEDVQSLTIKGFDDDITINNILKDDHIVIDGEKGTVKSNEKNKFNDTDLWSFPYFNAERVEQNIKLSSDQFLTKIKYIPLYL